MGESMGKKWTPNVELCFYLGKKSCSEMHLADNEQRYLNYLCATKDQMKHYYAEKTVSCAKSAKQPRQSIMKNCLIARPDGCVFRSW